MDFNFDAIFFADIIQDQYKDYLFQNFIRTQKDEKIQDKK